MFEVTGFASGKRRKHLSHADLWEDFCDAIGPPMLVQKVWRSHVTEAETAAGLISPLEAYGNEVADTLAAKRALRKALSLEFVAAIRHTDSRVKLVQTNLLHVQNKPKIVSAVVKALVRRTKFDPTSAMSLLNRIGHDFSRTQIGKGRYTFKCRRCLFRGDRLFLKRLQGTPCSARPHDSRPPAPVPTHPASSLIGEPESFFIGGTRSSEDDPFGWGGDVEQNHHITSDQELFCSPDEQMDKFALIGARLPPSPARGKFTNAEMDPTGVDDDKPGKSHPGMTDTTRDGVWSIAMDLGDGVSRSEQGNAVSLGNASDDTVCTVTDSEAEPHLSEAEPLDTLCCL